MGARIQIGRILGTPTFWHISCFLVFILVIWSLDVLVLPVAAPGLTLLAYWEIAIGTGLVFLVSVLLHEVGHLWVARRHGIEVRSTTLYGFIGAAHVEGRPTSPGVMLQLGLIGPAVSLVLAGLFAWLWLLSQSVAWLVPALAWLAWLNLGVGLFNLLPLPPLAGWRVLQAIAWGMTGRPLNLRPNTIAFITEISGAAFILVGIFFLVFGNYVAAAWLGLLGWVLQQVSSAGRTFAAPEPLPAAATVAPPVTVDAPEPVSHAPVLVETQYGTGATAVTSAIPLSASLRHALELLENEEIDEVLVEDGSRIVAKVVLMNA